MSERVVGHGFPCGAMPFVQLTGQDGNAFAILGRCQRAARREDVPADEIEAFMADATSRDYDYLLQTVMRFFEVD